MNTVEEIAALLHIHKEATAHGDAMKNIGAAAYTRLIQINGEMSKESLLPYDDTQEAEPVPEQPGQVGLVAHDPEPEPVVEPEPTADHRRYAKPVEEEHKDGE